jgi:prepilin-type N-terminal cleavage/methylation domain-containing protein
MLQKLRSNSQGFTLIELMIVIAIIGILAAIAIPNFISYRNKAFCSAAESDANNIAAAIADYFAVPSRVNAPASDPTETTANGGLGMKLTNNNSGDIGGDVQAMTITVTDGSTRCPDDYQQSVPGWNVANDTYSFVM